MLKQRQRNLIRFIFGNDGQIPVAIDESDYNELVKELEHGRNLFSETIDNHTYIRFFD